MFQEKIYSGKRTTEYSDSLTVAIYKGKGDPLHCDKHSGLRLFEHVNKVIEKALVCRLRKLVNFADGQFGFKSRNSCSNAYLF